MGKVMLAACELAGRDQLTVMTATRSDTKRLRARAWPLCFNPAALRGSRVRGLAARGRRWARAGQGLGDKALGCRADGVVRSSHRWARRDRTRHAPLPVRRRRSGDRIGSSARFARPARGASVKGTAASAACDTNCDMSESFELPEGTVLGAYRLVRRIGTGGMGAVYEAEHQELRKRVALKTPYTEAGLSPEGRARFVQEGKTVSRIRHPHVVDITDVGEIDDIAYLVMEYLEGETLADLIRREGALDTQLIADILVPVAAALHEAHGLGIVHRDMKPDNIFLTHSVHGHLHPKVLDFGISKVVGDAASPRLTGTNAILGTPSYVSPEQLESAQSTTPMSDQYSLGVVIYEASTGENPFAGYTSLMSMMNAVVKGLYRRPLEVNPRVDERLARIALRAMSVSPSSRYRSMAELGAELLALASVDTRNTWGRHLALGAATALLPRPRASAHRLRRQGATWALGAAALVLIAAGAFALRPTEPFVEENVEVRALAESPPAERVTVAASEPRDREPSPAAPALARAEPPRAEPPRERPEPPPSAAATVESSPRARAARAPSATRPPRTNVARSRPASRPSNAASDASPTAGEPRAEREAQAPVDTRARASRAPASHESLKTDNVDPWDP
jgi:serine/threonine protein kinase